MTNNAGYVSFVGHTFAQVLVLSAKLKEFYFEVYFKHGCYFFDVNLKFCLFED